MSEASREAFEQKVREHFDPMRADELLFRNEAGNYEEWGVMLAWEAWQEARNQVIEEAAIESDKWIGCEGISKAIRALKVTL